MALHPSEAKILSVLQQKMEAKELAEICGMSQDSLMSFAQSLKEKGFVRIFEEVRFRLELSEEGRQAASQKLPEIRVLSKAILQAPLSSLSGEEKAVGLPWAIRQGWVRVEKGVLRSSLTSIPAYDLQDALGMVLEGRQPNEEACQILLRRKLARQVQERKFFIEKARDAPAEEKEGQISALTREILLSGSWRGAKLRPYDVHAPAEVPFAAKRHPISKLMQKISQIFSEMGFEQMEGEELQSSFWNFDALFQPQDHPARDLADTFYVKGSIPLPKDRGLVRRVKLEHERCWGGEWLEENAKKAVLRTHTTAISARYLYERCRGSEPKKYFAIGKVYRNEATDYKHLAEFFQVEGIVVWEKATFRDLLGCLKEFYRKLGFHKIRFQPSYFPYTEPSLEISVYFEKKRQWLELGGAGIFRPEVSIPLCGRYPVLAWGLSLERPLMLLNDMEDIRDFYKSSIGWLRSQKAMV
ncbi:MAG: phenylalanine--tRNA ligase subunit alpha [Candidatus Micrarchaeota archaeon]|nr:phenylalanine--tRNA ligase subunit alpha [Candidatus Micrarchaeota archaeon]